jgi:Icc-related predicted phosphoesterase
MRLLCLADIHGDAAGLRAILPVAGSVDLVVVAGDVTQLGGRAESRTVLEPLLETGARVIAVGGNMDRTGAREYLAERKIDIHGRGILIDSIAFIGLGGGTHSPFATPWELAEEEAAALLAAGHAEVAQAGSKVLVSHSPPRDTELDRVKAGMHVGSAAVRAFLTATPIQLCICGHIHEAGGTQAVVGGCLCLNVGPFRHGRYAIVEITPRVTAEGDPFHGIPWRAAPVPAKPTVTWRMR